MWRSAHERISGPSFRRKNVLSSRSDRKNARDERLFSAFPTPFSRAGTTSLIVDDASLVAFAAVPGSTPTSVSQLVSVSLADASCARSSSNWLVMPPRIAMTTPATTTMRASSRSAVPTPRGTPWRSSDLSTGDATAATTAAAITGVTIVCVSVSSQTRATTSTVTPTASHAVWPRSRSQRAGANSPVRLCASYSTPSSALTSSRATSGGERLPLQLIELGLVDRAAVEEPLRVVDLRGRPAGDRPDVLVHHGLLRLHVLRLALRHAVVLGDQVDECAEERHDDDEHAP